MSIIQKTTIDGIGIRKDKRVDMIITDHLDWHDENYHLACLQDKLNAYLSFCLDGQFEKSYPDYKNRPVVIRIVSQFGYPEAGLSAVQKTRDYIKTQNVDIEVTQETLRDKG